MVGIYKITNPKNRIYIGQSIDVENRISSYKKLQGCASQPKIKNSLKKYGVDKHKFEIVIECDVDDLNKWERYYQDLYSAIGKFGLNCILTNYDGNSGMMSEETKKKLSIAKKGVKRPDMLGDKNIFHKLRFEGEKNHFFNKNHSEESKSLMREKSLGNTAWKSRTTKVGFKSGENNPVNINPKLKRISQITQSWPVNVLQDGKVILTFECTHDAGLHFNCTKENILFRAKSGIGKAGIFKGLVVELIK